MICNIWSNLRFGACVDHTKFPQVRLFSHESVFAGAYRGQFDSNNESPTLHRELEHVALMPSLFLTFSTKAKLPTATVVPHLAGGLCGY